MPGKANSPMQASSIDTRRRELQAFARMAVKQGYPVESLNSLADLLDPDLVEEVLEAYWEENGDEPRVWTIDMAWKLLASPGKQSACRRAILRSSMISGPRWRSTEMEHHRKELNVIRAVLTEGVWDKVFGCRGR